MSRSGYVDGYGDDDPLALGRYRAQVASAIRGKRGQKLLRDLRDALDAMPEKRLIANELEDGDGEVCALGAVGKLRGIDMAGLDPEAAEQIAKVFDIAEQLAREIVYENDEGWLADATPEQRWRRISKWVDRHLKAATTKEPTDE